MEKAPSEQEEANRKLEKAQTLDTLKKTIHGNHLPKGGGVDPGYDLTPSRDGWDMLKHYNKNINKRIKDDFRKYQTLPEKGSLKVVTGKKDTSEEKGTTRGQDLHKLLSRAVTEFRKPVMAKDREPTLGDKIVKVVTDEYHGLQLFESEFRLYGYMQEKADPAKVYYWHGESDAIGWYDNHYVIVEWKTTPDLMDYWERDRNAFGDHLHQCIAYAQLLKLHLQLRELPYILIVPIGYAADIHPGLFKDYPPATKDKLDEFHWSVKKPDPFIKVTLDKNLFAADKLKHIKLTEDGTVPPDTRLKDLFQEGATVGELMKTFARSLPLKIVPKE